MFWAKYTYFIDKRFYLDKIITLYTPTMFVYNIL